uniref:DnaJ (Hsp40) homolog, subfamily C, member 15 n=1 Tax=Sinocyclocheilus grahami TaxID=75366 RepID=A0A672L3Q4_SINGR
TLCISIQFKTEKGSFSAYYKGGFEQKMTRREASFILGISTKAKVLEGHRRIMVLNHPDKGQYMMVSKNILSSTSYFNKNKCFLSNNSAYYNNF